MMNRLNLYYPTEQANKTPAFLLRFRSEKFPESREF